ncbi:MAG: C39 family peptidase [Anaerolineae bacterium]|nr:C39 family peptidase [Anaerolineae bacterium]
MSPVMLPVPHMRQRHPGECLAACAAMVLTYLGFSTSYERLLKLLRVEQGIGTPASNIRELGQLGVTVIYKQGTLAELHDHLTNDRPCIAFVQSGELPHWNTDTDHAIVVVGLDETYIYLNDPEFPDAPLQVPHGDFDLAWLEWDECYATFISST